MPYLSPSSSLPAAMRSLRADAQGTVQMRPPRRLGRGTQSGSDLSATRVIRCVPKTAAPNAAVPSYDDYDDASDYTLVDAPVFLDVEWS